MGWLVGGLVGLFVGGLVGVWMDWMDIHDFWFVSECSKHFDHKRVLITKELKSFLKRKTNWNRSRQTEKMGLEEGRSDR